MFVVDLLLFMPFRYFILNQDYSIKTVFPSGHISKPPLLLFSLAFLLQSERR